MVEKETSSASRPRPPLAVPFRAVVLSIVGLWLGHFLLITMRSYVAGFEMQDQMLWRRGVVTLVSVAMTFALWGLLYWLRARPIWLQITVALVAAWPMSYSIAAANHAVFSDIQKKEEEIFAKEHGINLRRDEKGNLLIDISARQILDAAGSSAADIDIEDDAKATVMVAPAPTASDRWQMIFDLALGRYFVLLAWASLYLALAAGVRAREAERRAGEFRSAANAAELRSLRYQVNPHFLFNTLNSLSSLILTGKNDRAESMVQMIANFYRQSLTDDPTTDTILREEFDLQRLYLEIESARFPNRLKTEFDLPVDLESEKIPGMILQPLVENSVKYAVSAVSRPVTISISAREEYGKLLVSICDDGPGLRDDAPHGYGIGLTNVRQRLQARFGKEAHMVSGPSESGYATHIRIPLRGHG